MIDYEALRRLYEQRLGLVLEPLSTQLRAMVEDRIRDLPRLDRVASRAKSVASFMEKASRSENGKPKYSDPIRQIQDQLGVRIVIHSLSDREAVSRRVRDYFNPIEAKIIVPESPKEFDYEAMHYIFLVPKEFHTEAFPEEHRPTEYRII